VDLALTILRAALPEASCGLAGLAAQVLGRDEPAVRDSVWLFCYLGFMEPAPPAPQRSIDVTGLPDEVVRAVELYVSQLRGQEPPGVPAGFASREEWAQAVRAWAESHPQRDALADDSREAIYADGRDE
jgi:hypothetical protein